MLLAGKKVCTICLREMSCATRLAKPYADRMHLPNWWLSSAIAWVGLCPRRRSSCGLLSGRRPAERPTNTEPVITFWLVWAELWCIPEEAPGPSFGFPRNIRGGSRGGPPYAPVMTYNAPGNTTSCVT